MEKVFSKTASHSIKHIIYRIIKRIIDIFLSFIGLVLLGPLFLVISLIIKFYDGYSVFYRQIRIGQHGKPFYILKFRTMVQDADQNGELITHSQDERVTKPGIFLRKTKLDELPQLLNVLTGHMSFIGPRPEVTYYVNKFKKEYNTILQVKPGITDPSSLKYHNEESLLSQASDRGLNHLHYYETVILPDKLRLNIQYVTTFNMVKDIQILFATLYLLSIVKLIKRSKRKREILYDN